MAKIYSFEEYKLRRLIRELRHDLCLKIEYCDRNGYLWVDHYTIKNLSERIDHLINELEILKNDKIA